MPICDLGYWLNTPNGLVNVRHIAKVRVPESGRDGKWELKADLANGQTVTLLDRIPSEDEADRLYDAVRAFINNPEEAEECAPHLEDLPVYYRQD